MTKWVVTQQQNKTLNDLSIEEIQKIEPKLNKNVLNVFNIKNSIDSKKSFGGTSFANIKKMIRSYEKDL